MIKACAWHPQEFGKVLFMGEIEPLDNKAVTHGICKDCAFIVTNREYQAIKKQKADTDYENFTRLLHD
jgi:hypothetical protein